MKIVYELISKSFWHKLSIIPEQEFLEMKEHFQTKELGQNWNVTKLGLPDCTSDPSGKIFTIIENGTPFALAFTDPENAFVIAGFVMPGLLKQCLPNEM